MTEVFYRKWRPQRLDQVVGQEAIARTLRNEVTMDRVAQAYMFCGPRGTGKTSTARILAKAVNCLSPEEGEPDNRCVMCVGINEGRAIDLVEIDAASNRGIDDIRSLREKVHFVPNEARYKVYIVDEVHMLTEPAFNALLKTLEEPPDHAIFVLATTEVHKVPLTIISRCQRFDFRRIPLDTASIAPRAALPGRGDRSRGGGPNDAGAHGGRQPPGRGEPARAGADLLRLPFAGRAGTGHAGSGHVPARPRPSRARARQVGGRRAEADRRGVVGRRGPDPAPPGRHGVPCAARYLVKSGAGATLDYPEETSKRISLPWLKRCRWSVYVSALKAFSTADVRRDNGSRLPLELATVEVCRAPEAQPAAASVREPTREYRRAAPTAPAPATRRTYERPAPSPPPQAAPVDSGGDLPLPSEPAARLERQWPGVVRTLSRHKGKRFNIGALLRACSRREVSDSTVSLEFSHPSHKERMEEEIEDLESSRVLKEALSNALDAPVEAIVCVVNGQANGPRQSAAQRSHLVRAAQKLGAQVVDEKGGQE